MISKKFKFRSSFLVCIIFWILVRNCIDYASASRCQSCFAGCRTFDDCDCEGDENSTCQASFCYAKLEYFTDDGVSAIQKGCVNEASTSFLGCQYASDDRSIACYCSGDLCNSARNLSQYETPDLPLVTCCECNEDETGSEACFPQNCTRNCTGNYCYLDMVANAQGCGWGHPQLFHFLRAQKYRRWENELTCAEYYDNYRNYMSGCTCSNDLCNVVQNTSKLNARRTKIDRKNHFCHNLFARSDRQFGAEVYRHASLCPSYFCFISWTSVEVVFDPSEDDDESVLETGSGQEYYSDRRQADYAFGSASRKNSLPTLRSAYEISAGCLHVDNEEKVQIGCTTEWSQNERTPLTKHCVCSEELCNDFHLIDESYVRENFDRPPFRHGSLSSHGPIEHSTTTAEYPTETDYFDQDTRLDQSPDPDPDPDPVPVPTPTPEPADRTLIAVTSAFATSPITEPNLDEKTTDTPSVPNFVETTHPPVRPPKGQFRSGHSSSGTMEKGFGFTFLLVVFFILLSVNRTA